MYELLTGTTPVDKKSLGKAAMLEVLRIVREVEHILARNRPGDVLFVGHGGVGTLLYCHYSGFAIDRTCDQPAGGGYFFAFAENGRRVQHSWRRIEDL